MDKSRLSLRVSHFVILRTLPASAYTVLAVITAVAHPTVTVSALIELYGKLLCGICLCSVKRPLTQPACRARHTSCKCFDAPTDHRYFCPVPLTVTDRTVGTKPQGLRINSDMLIKLSHPAPPFLL